MMKRRDFLTTSAGAAFAGLIFTPSLAGAAAAGVPDQIQRFHAARRFLDTRFGRIAYVEQGKGPAAIFLHGWPLNGFHWRDSMAALSTERRCIAADFMGLGYSEVPAGTDLSPIRQAEMVVAVMDQLGVDRADLISNDSATTIAQLLAAHYPDRVRSMLITNGDVHTNSPPESLKPVIEDARNDRLADWFESQLRNPRIAQTKEGLGIVYTDPAFLSSELVDVYLTPLLADPRRRRQCQLYGIAFEPNPLLAIEPKLRASAIPARIVWGTGDALFGREWAAWLDEALPQSRGVRYVDGANLFFPEEYPEIIIEEARHLWASYA